MTITAILNPDGHDLDPFLFAAVGEDRNGGVVTVASTLARLGFDPWKEAAELAALSQGAANARIDALLSGFRDVPALVREHGPVAERLTLLLPKRRSHPVSGPGGSSQAGGPSISTGLMIAILVTPLVLVQVLILGAQGSGE